MDNDFRLIDKLINYTNNFNRVFPIKLVINLDKDIIIKRIDYCINNNVLYDEKQSITLICSDVLKCSMCILKDICNYNKKV